MAETRFIDHSAKRTIHIFNGYYTDVQKELQAIYDAYPNDPIEVFLSADKTLCCYITVMAVVHHEAQAMEQARKALQKSLSEWYRINSLHVEGNDG